MFSRLLNWRPHFSSSSRTQTFSEMSKQWLAEYESRFAPSWNKTCRAILKSHLGELGPVRADRISRRQVAHALSQISAVGVANQAHTVTSSIFS